METAKITSKAQITIPISVREALELAKGDSLLFYKNDQQQFVIEKYTNLQACPNTSKDCLLCLGSGQIHYHQSLFEHIALVKQQLNKQLVINWLGQFQFELYCAEHVLTDFEKEHFTKWAMIQMKKEMI